MTLSLGFQSAQRAFDNATGPEPVLDGYCQCGCAGEDHKYDPETGESPCEGCAVCDDFDQRDYYDYESDAADEWYSAYKSGDFN